MTTDDEAVSYLRWRKDVADHDYAAASSYLSIRFGQDRANEVSEKLRKLPVITRRANDILRATMRDALPLSDPGVLKEWLCGKKAAYRRQITDGIRTYSSMPHFRASYVGPRAILEG